MTSSAGNDPAGARSPRTPASEHLGPVDACPGCGDRDFLVEDDGDVVIFRCLGCTTGWRYELGFVWAIASPELASPDRRPRTTR